MKRIIYIDIIKILAIYLVILGHSPIVSNSIKQWIYSFHMPTFFALYGMTYNLEKHIEGNFLTQDFIKRKFKRLIVPSFIWAFLYCFINSLFSYSFSWKSIPFLIYGSQASFKIANSLTSIWFLPCMFLAVLLFELSKPLLLLIKKGNCKNSISISTLCILLFFIYSYISYIMPSCDKGYPWSINVVPMACSFILFGFVVQSLFNKYIKAKNIGVTFFLFLIAFTILMSTFKYNISYIKINNVDMASSTYGNYFLYLLDALCGITMMYCLGRIIPIKKMNRTILFISMNTLAIFLIHKPLIIEISKFNIFSSQVINSFTESIIILLISAFLAKIIDRFCPIIIGNHK